MTRFTELVGTDLPLQLAGMGAVAGPELCAAVSAAGGLGMVALPTVPAPVLEEILSGLRGSCEGPFGVNFLMPFLDLAAVDVAAGLAPLVEFFYGDPDPTLVGRARPALVAWQVGSVDEARAAAGAGADLVVAQGTEAGGHVRGSSPLRPLLDEVLGAVDVPVVAAGGLSTPAAVAAAMAAGAHGVRVGTPFLAAVEADVHPAYAAAVLAATGGDTVLTTEFDVRWPDAPHRVLRSAVERADAVTEEVIGSVEVAGQRFPVPRHSPMTATRSFEGDVAAAALYAGEGVGDVHRIRPAAEIVAELAAGFA